MLLNRFLSYFNRVVMNDDAADTKIVFMIEEGNKGQPNLEIKSLRFDVGSNQWVIDFKWC